ncbi:outer membrane protein assembly factor BamB family protein [Maribellus maritimus]|uniref:outer membrane protein assembly factor BamB family protein n=1 Tax=Maribellus maritimus TaxID=2870838 RepID=UPI001EEB9F4F|nr:PQQ-binding-like beta-propeller repeat protein [Maribellus maritimus]MCG6191180.1 PQQ-binding-like beta-propeller repeat protein [Maribellus maritimus]
MKKRIFIVIGIIVTACRVFGQNDGITESKTKNERNQFYGFGWSASHSDGGNTDYSPIQGAKKLNLAWQRKFEGAINLGPTSDLKGQVYVTTNGKGCHLYAIDFKTGETVWCTEKVNRFAVASSALLDSNGRIFIADNEAMYAFDDTGNLLWQTPIIGFPFSAQFTQTGRLIFITHIGRIYVLDRETGEQILQPVDLTSSLTDSIKTDVRACMRGTKDCPCANTLAFDHKSGRFFFTFWEPESDKAGLRAMQYIESPVPELKSLWINKSLPGGSASSPDLSFDGRRLYVNDNAGALYAVDALTGENIWRFEIGYEPGGSQSTSPDGIIIPAGGNNAPILCVADKGNHAEIIWKIDSLQNRGVAPQCAGNLAYVTVKTRDFQNDLVVIDTTNGKIIDREHLPGTTIFTVGTTIGCSGYVYVPSFNGHLFAFSPESTDF